MSDLLRPLTLRGVTLPNRIAMSPMCQYSCAPDGMPTAWHMTHLGSRAVGGAGLVFTEATAVTAEGRISYRDTGIWSDAHIDAWRPIAEFVAASGAVPAMQLAHAGFKASVYWPFSARKGGVADEDGGWTPVGPVARQFIDSYRTPRALDEAGIAGVVGAFAAAAARAVAAGFRAVEIHAAHGYLLHEFYTPLINTRTDAWGADRTRLAVSVARAVREAVGPDVAVFARISTTDWVDGGWTVADSAHLAAALAGAGVDLIDCSSGGAVADAVIPLGPGYQVPMAAQVRAESGVPTGAVGLITQPAQAEEIIASGAADIVLVGRAMLRDPYWARRAADALGDQPHWPDQYLRAF